MIRLHPQRPRKGKGRIIDRQDYYWQDPEGQEHHQGTYASESAAKAALTRALSPDYRARCIGPYTKEETAP